MRNNRRKTNNRRSRSPLVFDSADSLREHRELEYLRVAGDRRRRTRKDRRRHLDYRERKLRRSDVDFRRIRGDHE